MTKLINTTKLSGDLRKRAINVPAKQVLISKISDSIQELDITSPLECEGYGRIKIFRQRTKEGWPTNPLPIVPACRSLGISSPPNEMNALVYQNAACAWRCWYCFVPYTLLGANKKYSKWFTADELIEFYMKIPDRPLIIDLSGGSPDLVPEWTIWMMQSLIKLGLNKQVYLWNDENLSTNYLFEKLQPHDLKLMRSYRNYGRVCCIKGYDVHSFEFNTHARDIDFENQFKTLRKVVELGIDVYVYITLTTPTDNNIDNGVKDIFDKLQSINVNLPLRVVPLRIEKYSSNEFRINEDSERERSLDIQDQVILKWVEELNLRFDESMRKKHICDVPLQLVE